MYDNALYEVSRAHQEEMQRQAAKARRGGALYHTPHHLANHLDGTLPLWLSSLLAHAPFGRRGHEGLDGLSQEN